MSEREELLQAQLAALERENQRLKAEITELRESRENVLATLAHELRTPLQSLSLTTELALAHLRNMGESLERTAIQSKLMRTRRYTLRLKQLVDTAMTTVQVSTGRLQPQREPVDLVELVRHILAREEDEIRWSGCEVAATTPDSAVGDWDRLQLDLVVSNLLSNATKYGRGLPVTVTVDAGPELVRLSVRDRGPGIPLDLQPRLFEKFSRLQATSNVAGVGLGLWLVRQIIAAHGGAVEVVSREGEGATFAVVLPRKA